MNALPHSAVLKQQEREQGPSSGRRTVAAAASAVPPVATTTEGWTPLDIPLPVVDERASFIHRREVLKVINLAEMIGKGPRAAKDHLTQRHYLSSAYNHNSAQFRKLQLAPLFQEACARGGFEIVMRGWEECRDVVRFACQRSRSYKHNRDRRKSSASSSAATHAPPKSCTGGVNADETKTGGSCSESGDKEGVLAGQRPTKETIRRPMNHEELCPFNFSVYWQPGHQMGTGRWFLCACGIGRASHVGHAPRSYEQVIQRRKELRNRKDAKSAQSFVSTPEEAFRKLLPQYKTFCELAAASTRQMDYAKDILTDAILALEQSATSKKKRKRGMEPNQALPPRTKR